LLKVGDLSKEQAAPPAADGREATSGSSLLDLDDLLGSLGGTRIESSIELDPTVASATMSDMTDRIFRREAD